MRAVPPATRGSLLRHLLRGMPVLVVGMVIMYGVQKAGWLDRFNTAALDSVLLLRDAPRMDSVVIVEITEADYRALFGARSPLDRNALRGVIDAIRDGRPHLIIVDIDTSEGWDNDVWLRDANGRLVDKCVPPIVWAQRPVVREGDDIVYPVPFADARHVEPPCASGLALVPRDPDRVVRRYVRQVWAKTGPVVQQRDSLPWAAAKMQSRFNVAIRPDAGDSLILTYGDPYSFQKYSASEIVAAARNGEAWGVAGPLTNRIVLLGGTFSASGDSHLTPRGSISGVELLAHIVAAELFGTGIRVVNDRQELAVEFTVGVVLIVVGYFGLARTVAVANFVLIPIFALVGSYFVFSTLSQWFSFVPHWLSVALQQWLERRRFLAQRQDLRSEVPTEPRPSDQGVVREDGRRRRNRGRRHHRR